MKKSIEGNYIVFTKSDDINTVGCHVRQDVEYDEVKIEAELDLALENLRLKNQ